MKSLLYCRDPGKAGQNFIPAKRDHVITPLDGKKHEEAISDNISTKIRCRATLDASTFSSFV